MKKQNCFIEAHLFRSALILLSLSAACAIPFALAHSRSRETAKRSGPVNTSPVEDPWHGSAVVCMTAENIIPGAVKFRQFDYPGAGSA